MSERVTVLIDRGRLTHIRDLSLTRSTESVTGELRISVFMDWMPEERVFNGVIRGAETLVYIGEHLAFTGTLDSRRDSGTPPGEYEIDLVARGRAKRLIDNSHRHPTGTILRTTNRQVFDTLVRPFGMQVDWLADEVPLNRVRLRQGAKVYDELRRIGQQTGVSFYETRDGRLRVVDGPIEATGEPIVLGSNIISFDADLRGDVERREITVTGQRTEANVWGEAAIIPPVLRLSDGTIPEDGDLTVQMYGSATPDALQRAGTYDYNRRVAAGREVSVQLFGLLQSTGEPWDLGVRHQVQIPPAGVAGEFQASSLSYAIDHDARLRTNISLHPPLMRREATASLLDALPTAENSGEWVSSTITENPDRQSEIPEVAASLLDDLGDGGSPPLILDVP